MLWGYVALNNKFCLSTGRYLTISAIDSPKPISSIRSASSSTKVSKSFNERFCFLRCSSILPGVPTTICAPCSSEPFWGPNAAPPHNVSTFMLRIFRPSVLNSFATWSASSRVGHNTRHCTLNFLTSSLFNIPRPKAAVFPEPVFAWAITSWPSSILGNDNA